MSSTAYPSTLPGPSAVAVTSAERRLLSDVTGGPQQTRGLQRDYLANEQIEWTFSANEAAIFQAWWRTDLIYGGRWFASTWPTPAGWVATARRFKGAPTWSLMAVDAWRVAAQCEVRGRGLLPQTPAVAVGGWNPLDMAPIMPAAYLLTNANKTASLVERQYSGIRGLTSKTSGLLYFEVSIEADNPFTAIYFGVASADYPLISNPYPSPGGKFVVYYNVGRLINDSGLGASVQSFVTGDVLGFEVNFTTHNVAFYKNNVFMDSAGFAAGSAMFPMTHTIGITADAIDTLHTSAADQAYSSRSGGYVSWD